MSEGPRGSLDYPDWPLHRFVQNAADEAPEQVVLRFDEEVLTYGELDVAGNRLALALRYAGIKLGDRVLLLSANRTGWLIAQHGVSVAGAASVLGNSSWKSQELAHAISLTNPVAVIADAASAAVVEQCGAAIALRICFDDVTYPGWRPFDQFTAGAPASRPTEWVVDPATTEALLPFSSGTTGMPKAVRHSHGGLVIASFQRVDAWKFTDQDRIQYFMALFTIFGVLVTTATFAARASMRLFRRFDPVTALRNMADERITFGFAAAPVAVALRDCDDLETYDLSSVRFLMWGATPIVPEIAESVTARTGVRWLGAYATTEIGLTSNPAEDPQACRIDTPGLALADTDIRIVDPDTGAEMPTGERGEIVARSPSVMLGYLPEADNEGAFYPGGWYRTGDIGWIEPDGWVHVTDRLKDMIKVSGFAVAPAEIERTLFLHPAVADCAVYGVPDATRGEAPKAAVVVAPGVTVDASALIAFVAEHLATYKHLRDVAFVDAIPRNAAGKVLRRVLREGS